MRGWLVVAAALVGGCGKDICDRDERNDLDCGAPHPPALTEECKSDLRECDGADRRLLSDYQDCLEEVGAADCELTDEAIAAGSECFDLLGDLSDDCAASRVSGGTAGR